MPWKPLFMRVSALPPVRGASDANGTRMGLSDRSMSAADVPSKIFPEFLKIVRQ
jgi:hypothetical protein